MGNWYKSRSKRHQSIDARRPGGELKQSQRDLMDNSRCPSWWRALSCMADLYMLLRLALGRHLVGPCQGTCFYVWRLVDTWSALAKVVPWHMPSRHAVCTSFLAV